MKQYAYDLKNLEDELSKSYAGFVESNDDGTRTSLFDSIQDLAIAILKVGKYRNTDLDKDQMSYDYACSLFERIVSGDWIPEIRSDRFPWQKYVSKNILDTIHPKKSKTDSVNELVSDLEYILNTTSASIFDSIPETPDQNLKRQDLAYALYDAIKIHYSDKEIRRLFGISIDLVLDKNKWTMLKNYPQDIKDFVIVLVCMAKRLILDNNINRGRDIHRGDLSKIMSSVTRSSIFLSAIVNPNRRKFVQKELLLALDLASIYRLAYALGGKLIRIPSIDMLDTLVGTSVILAKRILEGKKLDRNTRQKVSRDYGIIFRQEPNLTIQEFCSKAIEVYETFQTAEDIKPIMDSILKSAKSLEIAASKICENPEMEGYREILSDYSTVIESLLRVGASIEIIHQKIQKKAFNEQQD